MNSDLYPTPNRVALLRNVAAGKVRHYRGLIQYDADGYSVDQIADRRCTAEIAAMRRAGWVNLGAFKASDAASKAWELTDAGRAVLAEHGGAR